jgi:transposase-like protein
MKASNKYYKAAKIGEAKFRQIIRCFSEDLTASSTSRMTGVSVRSVNDIFLKIRRRLAVISEAQSPLDGKVEMDESYFGPTRVRGKRGRGAGQKTIVFGILKRGENVYTRIIPNAAKSTLRKVIRGRVSLSSVIHSDGWIGYDGLVDVGYAKHLRVRHADHEFAVKDNHINGIESFWSFAKHRLSRFHGIPKHTFYLHLKESEFRFNHRHGNLYRVLLKMFREDPL